MCHNTSPPETPPHFPYKYPGKKKQNSQTQKTPKKKEKEKPTETRILDVHQLSKTIQTKNITKQTVPEGNPQTSEKFHLIQVGDFYLI